MGNLTERSINRSATSKTLKMTLLTNFANSDKWSSTQVWVVRAQQAQEEQEVMP